MAIQISGTTVIDNSRNVTNVLGVGNSATTIYYGDGSQLTNLPSPTISDSFIPEDTKTISVNTTINNGQSNISFAEDLVIGTGVTFTVSAGSTVRMDALNVINCSVLSASVDLDIPNGTTAQRPGISTASGSFRYNSQYDTIEIYVDSSWRPIALGTYVPSPGDIGIFGGGSTPTLQNVVDYITISSTGDTSDFGDLTLVRSALAACSNTARGVFGGASTPTVLNVIDYITIASVGNAISFGNLTVARSSLAACSSSTRGVFGGGGTPTISNVIDYITIATIGNATDFGDLSSTRNGLAACSSSTRGVFGGGLSPLVTNTIDYITIASVGNATDFGDLTVARQSLTSCSSSTRGVFGGGTTPTIVNTIDYITIATTGNATDFGDLSVSRAALAACSSAHGGLS